MRNAKFAIKLIKGITMKQYTPPLSIFYVWHPADTDIVKPVIAHCSKMFSSDVSKPVSRAMNLPLFYITSSSKNVPDKISVQTNKAIIVLFVSQEVASDNHWSDYYENLPSQKHVFIVPIALDKYAFNIRGVLKNKNFIRAYEYDKSFFCENSFIAIAHETYRFALNDTYNEISLGKDTAIEIFISHAKDNGCGANLALALKNYIDNSAMNNFFDATDIAPSYVFSKEIEGHIKKSSIVAIHSDPYSSRYWCQKEMILAKEYNRPIVVVDILENYEDRRFPFSANIPAVHVNFENEPTKRDLLRILSTVLLETIRYFYSKILLENFKEAGWFSTNALICSRPPDLVDIANTLINKDNKISLLYDTIIYPEPSLYPEELEFIKKLGIKICTPYENRELNITDKKIGIFISNPTDEELLNIGLSRNHLYKLSQDLSRHLIMKNALIIYGGDLRKGGFTQFILDESLAVQNRTNSTKMRIENYESWPQFLLDSAEIKMWKASYRTTAKIIEMEPANDTMDLIPNVKTYMPFSDVISRFVWSRSLSNMRYQMINACDVRICAGGRLHGFKGILPGLLEEVVLAIKLRKPIFLLGGFGGITSSICSLLTTGIIPDELKLEWQLLHNSGYSDLLDFYKDRKLNNPADYTEIVAEIKNSDLYNGLDKADNEKLFKTPFIEEAIHLVFKGISNLYYQS